MKPSISEVVELGKVLAEFHASDDACLELAAKDQAAKLLRMAGVIASIEAGPNASRALETVVELVRIAKSTDGELSNCVYTAAVEAACVLARVLLEEMAAKPVDNEFTRAYGKHPPRPVLDVPGWTYGKPDAA